MADTSTGAESSTSSSSRSREFLFDVFLSFRGEDTRNNFTDHLYSALVRRGFLPFKDSDKLERGGAIALGLLFAIERSRISVVVFSRNYAASRWCLDELVKIMECKKTFKQIVLPVFYDVDPSDVRAQRGSFAEAFAKHEDRYRGSAMEGKLERWRAALTEAANLSGRHLQEEANGRESKFIEMIIEDISNQLNLPYLHVADYPIGIESRLQRVNGSLELGSKDVVRMVGIWGIGGIGKTTIAKAIFNQTRLRFEGCSFLANVREVSKHSNGLVGLQEQLISDILMNETRTMKNIDQGIEFIKQRLWCRRVLVVLDDVDDIQQLKALGMRRDWFHSGSRIIVTTRDQSLLKFLGVDDVYRPEFLTYDESLELFNWHAFRKHHPMGDYKEVSRKVVYYAGGLPLVLEVLGSFFASTSVHAWKSTLERLKKIPHYKIQEKLKISFDSLSYWEQNLFLDIACFFVGMDKNYASEILGADRTDLEYLSRRCLIKIDGYRLEMHDTIRDMGREIVRVEHCEELGKRRRLWFHEDILNVLKNHTGTEAIRGLVLNLPGIKNVQVNDYEQVVQGLVLNLPRIKNVRVNDYEQVDAKAFAKMRFLRLLKLDYVHLNGSYRHLPKMLEWLCWNGFPEKSIPSDLSLKEVVAIDMCYSRLKQVWKGGKSLNRLKFLFLSHSYQLTETPDFSGVPKLEMLFLNDCTRLEKVHQSIVYLNNLVLLDLKNCMNLSKLPLGIFKSKSLQNLILSGCLKLEKLLGFKGSSSKSWFSFFCPVRNSNSTSLAPSSIEGLFSIRRLILEDCNLSRVPEELGSLTSLEVLDLKRNKFCTIPESISQLSLLWDLCLSQCTELRSLPELPVNLKWVNATHCTSLERISIGPGFRKSPSLFFFGCYKLVGNNFASDFGNSFLQTQELSVIGEFSILFPGDEILDFFNYMSLEPSLSFVVPLLPNCKIRGWILCAVLKVHLQLWEAEDRAQALVPRLESIDVLCFNSSPLHFAYPFSYKVQNKTKDLESCYELAFSDHLVMHDCHTWLHYAPQYGLELHIQAGDRVKFSFIGVPSHIQVKECAINLIYEGDEKDCLSDDPSNGPIHSGYLIYPRETFKLDPGCHSQDLFPSNSR